MRWTLPIVAVLVLGSACVPIPFVTPPMRATFNVGGLGGTAHEHDGTELVEGEALDLGGRFGVYPLALVESMADRPVDVGLGYFEEGTTVDSRGWTLAQGPYVEVAYHPWQRHWETKHFARVTLFVTGDLLLSRHVPDALGGGVTGGVGFEWGQWVSDPFSASGEDEDPLNMVFGYAEGEGTVGVQVTAGYRHLAQDHWWVVAFGFTFRVPAAIGVWVVELEE